MFQDDVTQINLDLGFLHFIVEPFIFISNQLIWIDLTDYYFLSQETS